MYSITHLKLLIHWLSIALIILVLDQLSKIIINNFFYYNRPYQITCFLNLVLLYNKGGAFNILNIASNWPRYLFIIIGIIAIIYTIYLLNKHLNQNHIFCWMLTLILGGTTGNVIDRIIYGYVIDFIDIHINQWHWPTFNIADSAICIGTILFIINDFFQIKK